MIERAVPVKKLLGLAAVLEGATGLALMIYPPMVTRLLLGEAVSGAGIALGRVGGFALIALGLACWPDSQSSDTNTPALRALFAYNLLATLYLAYLRLAGESVGSLLGLAVALHGVLTFLLARAWFGVVRVERVKG